MSTEMSNQCQCQTQETLPHLLEQKTGVKGSDVYTAKGVGDDRVVLSVKAVRDANPMDLLNTYDRILSNGTNEYIKDAAVLPFQIRDIRGGKGERAIFETLFSALAIRHADLAGALLSLVPEYGTWGDLFTLYDRCPTLQLAIFNIVALQLEKDEDALATGDVASISLLAKWAPREGNRRDKMAGAFAKYLWIKPKARTFAASPLASYRKRMSALNRAIKTVEVLECANRWDEIEPKRVPGRARENKRAAYLNEKLGKKGDEGPVLRHPDDPKRMACRINFQEFLAAAAAGTVKISGAQTLYPHELARKMHGISTPDEKNGWNAVWRTMVQNAPGLGSSIAMCDFSGSMGCGGGTPYWVSMAMGLLIASVNTGAFKNKFMTFDSTPQWHTVPDGSTLEQGIQSVFQTPGIGHGLSTDFQKAMDLVLGTLKAQRVKPGDEPKNLIVITDMGWDQACASNEASAYTMNTYRHINKTAPWQTHIQMIREAFKRAGEDMWGEGQGWTPPRIVIWNVAASNTDDFHAQANTEGVIMLAGWSPSLFKILCEEGPRITTPYDGLRAQLDAPRYDPVRTRVQEWLDGGWRSIY